MAAIGPPKELCEEVTCSICLEYFKNPVILDCGHNFCKSCLTQHWGGFGMTASCPHCRERDQRKNFRPNWQLANVVELVKKLQENKRAGGREQMCPRHQEPLKLFCRDDRALLCVVCDRSMEHRNHSVLPLEEVPQECEPPMFPSRHILKVSESSSPYNSKGRGVSWRHPEVIDLLSIWGEQKIQEQLRRSHRNLDSFELIAQEMRRRGHKRTALECRTKTKALRLEYRRVVNHNMIPGNSQATCPYYNELHSILCGDAIGRRQPVTHSFSMGKQHEEDRPVLDISEDLFSCDRDIMKPSEYHGKEDDLMETPALDNVTEDPEETVIHIEDDEPEQESPIVVQSQSPPSVDPPVHPEEVNANAWRATNEKKATLSPASRLAAIRNRRSRVGSNEAAERFMRHSSAENKRFLDAQQRFLEAAAADTKAFAQYMEHVRREDEALRRDRRELIDSIKRQTLLLEQVLLNLCASKGISSQQARDEQELREHTNGWAEAYFPAEAPMDVPIASSTSMDTLDEYRPARLVKKHVI